MSVPYASSNQHPKPADVQGTFPNSVSTLEFPEDGQPFVIPSNAVGLLGTRNEFERARLYFGEDFPPGLSMESDGGLMVCRVFLVPSDWVFRRSKRVDGFNIKILKPGTILNSA